MRSTSASIFRRVNVLNQWVGFYVKRFDFRAQMRGGIFPHGSLERFMRAVSLFYCSQWLPQGLEDPTELDEAKMKLFAILIATSMLAATEAVFAQSTEHH